MSAVFQPKKLLALHEYIATLLSVTAKSRDLISDYDSKEVEPMRIRINDALVTGSFNYVGNIYLIGFNEKPFTEDELEALISLWLYDNDPYYNKNTNRGDRFQLGLTIERVMLDQGSAALKISVIFNGITALIKDVAGKITVGGEKYRVANPMLDAENFEPQFINNSR
jgi:hypothetical protein